MRNLTIKQLEKKLPPVLTEVYRAIEVLENASYLMDEICERCDLETVSELQAQITDLLDQAHEVTDNFEMDDVITEWDESRDE
jgi:DNA-binding IscR family transcriptional regulator